jgi:Zn-dependent protease with chaperone function
MFAILLFAVEIYFLDFKTFLVVVPFLGKLRVFVNSIGLGLFLLKLCILWYWSHRELGDTMGISSGPWKYIGSNIKFNLAIVLPWILMFLMWDLMTFLNLPGLTAAMDSILFQIIFFGCYLVILALFAPFLITVLWDCRPMPDGPFKSSVLNLCRSQGVGFRDVVVWRALDDGLLTAGVLGIIAPFRYLMITPGLIKLLNQDEMLAVVSHEIGHVKKRHLLYYLLFFLGFLILSLGVVDRIIGGFINTELGFRMYLLPEGRLKVILFASFVIFVSLSLFIVYFRFLFGFFMRNFERQADLHCFQTGVDPIHMINAFNKLSNVFGKESDRSNWHHFSIARRVAFLRKCMDEPGTIRNHHTKIRKALAIFMITSILFAVIALGPGFEKFGYTVDVDKYIRFLQEEISVQSDGHEFYRILGDLYYGQEKWMEAKQAYERSLANKPDQPDVLNNLAWLLLKSADRSLIDHVQALEFARKAIQLKKSAAIYDTLAEACLANSRFEKAKWAAREALRLARGDRSYFQKQVTRMEKAEVSSKSESPVQRP